LKKFSRLKVNIENYKLEAERAEREGDYGKVAEIRYGKVKEEEKLLLIIHTAGFYQRTFTFMKEEVDGEDIAEKRS
jgi:ATP-dependent Clp protease ATP-binding subunit ClpB